MKESSQNHEGLGSEKIKSEDHQENDSIYGPNIKEIIKKHDAALEQGKVYHLSASADLRILTPSIPAEEIKNGKIIWDMDEPLPEESRAVCLGSDIEIILEHNPIIKGYIYAPKNGNTEGFRRFYAEAVETGEWLDSAIVGEVRTYNPVEVEKVGEFEMVPTKGGLKPEIKWY